MCLRLVSLASSQTEINSRSAWWFSCRPRAWRPQRGECRFRAATVRECSTLYSCTGKGGIEEIEFAIVALGAGKQGRVAGGRRAVRLEGFCSGDKWRFHLGPAGPRRLERCRMRQKHTAKTRIVAPNSGFAYIASRGSPRWKSSVDLRKVWSVAMGDEILGSLGQGAPILQTFCQTGISATMLEQQARRMGDTACARKMQQAKRKLLAE